MYLGRDELERKNKDVGEEAALAAFACAGGLRAGRAGVERLPRGRLHSRRADRDARAVTRPFSLSVQLRIR